MKAKNEIIPHNYPSERKPTGPRPNAGRPAGMVEPTRTTITLEKSHLEALKEKYGAGWQEVLRSLIAAHLHAA